MRKKTLREKEETKKTHLHLCDIFIQREYNTKSVIYVSSEKRESFKREKAVAVVVVGIALLSRCREEAAKGGFAK